MNRIRSIAVLLATGALLTGGASVASADHSVFQHVSAGPNATGGLVTFSQVRVTPDGEQAFFESGKQLTADDGDNGVDVFKRVGDTVTRVSTGPAGGNGNFSVRLDGITPDGQTVAFSTTEALTSADTDTETDLYKRTANTTTLLSIGPNGENGPCTIGFYGGICNAFFGMSDDGRRVFFESGGHLVAGDEETHVCEYIDEEEGIFDQWPCIDGYVNSDGITDLVTSGSGDSRGAVDHEFAGMSPGGRAYFNTREPMLPSQDTDGLGQDVYEWSSGTLSVATQDATGFPQFLAVSDVGERLFYDTGSDLWERASGPDVLRTPGTAQDMHFSGISADGDHLYMSTQEALDPADTDVCFPSGCGDLYEQTSSGYRRMTVGGTGNYNGGQSFRGATPNGDQAYFITREPLLPQDGDAAEDDLYEFDSATGAIQLVSTGPADPGEPQFGSVVGFQGVSDDGSRVFFRTDLRLVSNDGNGNIDIYERAGGVTSNITRSPYSTQGIDCCRTSPTGPTASDGSKVFYLTETPLLPSDTDTLTDLYSTSRGDLAGYPRPAGATPLRVALVPAFEPCTSPNRVHGPPLAFGSCAPPASRTQYLTVGVGDGSPAFAKSIGHVRLRALPGNPGGPDDADVRLELSLTNVMWGSDLSDYAGKLRTRLSLRLTDRDTVVPGTTDFPFSFDAQCAATADTTIGGSCTVTTTADAITPGIVREGSRAIWGLGKVEVLDGGADGNPATVPGESGVLAVQGVFVP